MPSLAFRFRDQVRFLGLGKTLRFFPVWLVRPEYAVLVLDLSLPVFETRTESSLRWSRGQEGDIPRLVALNPALSRAEVVRRLEEGHECLLGWLGERLVHSRWEARQTAALPYLPFRFYLFKGDVLAYENFTDPACRGQGIQAAATTYGLRWNQEEGLKRSMALIAVWNHVNLRFCQDKVGRVSAGTLGYWNLGLGQVPFSTGGVRFNQSGEAYVPRA